jgi:uncharacterized protein (DUF362 family)
MTLDETERAPKDLGAIVPWNASPFSIEAQRKVEIARGTDPYATARAALSGVDLTDLRGLRVLVKPNAGRVAPPGSGIVTDARVVGAVLDALAEVGARVEVGDSPIAGVRGLAALDASGILAEAQRRSIRVLDLDARQPVRVALPEGRAIQRLEVCADVLEFDVVVSVPVAKCHMHTGVTLSLKNMKGCLWRRSKVDLHMLPPAPNSSDKSLDVAIADLTQYLRPHLSVIDGTTGLEGLGPSAGTPKQAGWVVVCPDPWAADAVACHLMGIRPEDVPHLRLGAERELGSLGLDALSVCPTTWTTWIDPFIRPPTNLAFEFEGVRVLDEASCSACQSTLLLFLKQYGAELKQYLPEASPVCVAIGKGHSVVPPETLCIGNCTRQHREQGIYIAGCPPVGSAIRARVEEHAKARHSRGEQD